MYVNYLDERVQFCKLHLQITPNVTVTELCCSTPQEEENARHVMYV
jgi:hypothetical protein